MSKKIVTISREFGSGGRLIGKKLAEKMGVPYYDKNILDKIAEEHGYSVEMIEEDEKKAKNGFFYSLSNAFGAAGYGPDTLSINEKFFIAQFDYITKLAEEGNGGVIVGRCADYVLREYKDATNVFVYAEEKDKLKRAIEEYGIPEHEAKKMLIDVDKARANYYRYHTGQKWGEPVNYHISMDSGYISIDDFVKIILDYVEVKAK
ncbi:MAG: cytidylate kinase-like family protein [Eubacteriaceae bacterium]|nr:cytidylate kinase-like family protein [Eubacteriaceae bacterium]